MVATHDNRQSIADALTRFGTTSPADASLGLLGALGYRSDKRLALKPNSSQAFLSTFDQHSSLNCDQARVSDWDAVDFLFQLTDQEIRAIADKDQPLLFDSKGGWDGSIIESYLFFAIRLKGNAYTKAELSGITRAVNRIFAMPVMLFFQYADRLTLAVIDRRLSKKDRAKDVLEKVTLIKDIRFQCPHRAHIEILLDLSIDELLRKHQIRNFVQLHRAWRETLDIQALNRRFFIEVRNWFYWARLHARFPSGARKDADGRDSEALIRLLTRLIFCWFLREKRLVPEDLFAEHKIEQLLSDWDLKSCEKDKRGRYYKAILQNLFFATLNTPTDEREFRSARSFQGVNKHYGDQRYFRHVTLFQKKAPVETLYGSIPFLNGGLFEMLDEIPGRDDESIRKERRVDGFSDVASKQPTVPDFLFFGDERRVTEIAELLGERTPPKARGLIHIFRDYKFTIEENTPLEQDIALDPELLGRAFENLLAEINPETGTIARKSTGSFYTPREIVNYMVEESIFRRVFTLLVEKSDPLPETETRLRELIADDRETNPFSATESDAIVAAIGRLRILDPACGSGAFPMGLLQRLVHILHKVDPRNERWKAIKLAALPHEMREKAETVFRDESFDYTRKLELIKDCIHGVDIQPTAIQISKLRFFLSLVIEQKDASRIRPLPNLETKFVCANSLLSLPRPDGWELFQHQIEPYERALLDVRARYFFAQDRREKDACRAEDRRGRQELSAFINTIGGSGAHELASAVAAWDPYKPDRVANYFDPESMFGVRDGFDITIGNPPYVRADEQSDWNRAQREKILESGEYDTLWEKWDLFVPFIERSYKLLKPGGVSTLIVSDAFCHAKYAQKAQNWLLKNSRILRLDFCSDVQIFDAAVRNLIYFFQRGDGTRHSPERRVHIKQFDNIVNLPSGEQAKLTYRVFFPEDTEAKTVSCPTVSLDAICYISVGMVVNAHEKLSKGSFTIDDLVQQSRDARHPNPFVEGKYIARWLPATHRWLEWGTKRAPALFRRQTFPELYTVPEKLISVDMAAGTPQLRVAFDDKKLFHNHSAWSFVPWYALAGVRNKSLKKVARYRGEKPPRPDLPQREQLETNSRRFSVKYLLGVMNSTWAREFLRANRRSNIHLYPDDWKKLPIPDVDGAQQQPIIELVDEILASKRQNADADVGAQEARLDELVVALFGSGSSTTTPSSLSSSSLAAATEADRGKEERSGHPKKVAPMRDASVMDLLRDKIIPELSSRTPYFDIDAVRSALSMNKQRFEPPTLNRYLHELTEGGFIFDAGRGWYSTIPKPFALNPVPIIGLVEELISKFPFLEFTCWSTEQIAPYGHHLLSNFVSFVHADRDAMSSVFERLRDTDWNAWLNPRSAATSEFTVRERTVVVRPRVTRQPTDGHLVDIEGLLVELFVETRLLSLLGGEEYFRVFSNVSRGGRISMGRLIDYARQRQPATNELLESINAGFSKNPALIDSG